MDYSRRDFTKILGMTGFLGLPSFETLVPSEDLVTQYVNVETFKLLRGFRIMVLSDLHSCFYGENMNDLMGIAREAKPHAVFLTGDIYDDVLPDENARILCKQLGNEFECFYVSGNHEYWSGRSDEIKQEIISFGITVLEGQTKEVKLNGSTVRISGVDDLEVGEQEFARQLENIDVNADYLNFLLAHRPEQIERYAQKGFDFAFSGHAHGGQWRIPGIAPGGLYAPNQGLFPTYTEGRYAMGKGNLYVTAGLARESTQIPRVGNPPEVLLFDVLPK